MMDRGNHAPVPFLAHPCARLTSRAVVQDKEILIWLRTIQKAVREIIESKRIADQKQYYGISKKDMKHLPLDELMLMLADLEREMKQAARALDFKHAAECPDEITRIKKLLPNVKW